MKHTVIAIVVSDDERVLLQKREDFRVWAFPGGYVEPNEAYADAAIRETFEETGMHVEIVKHIADFEQPQIGNTVHLYQCRMIGGEIIKRSAETVDVGWFALSALPDRFLPNMMTYVEAMHRQHPDVIQEALTYPRAWVMMRWFALSLRNLRNRYFRR